MHFIYVIAAGFLKWPGEMLTKSLMLFIAPIGAERMKPMGPDWVWPLSVQLSERMDEMLTILQAYWAETVLSLNCRLAVNSFHTLKLQYPFFAHSGP